MKKTPTVSSTWKRATPDQMVNLLKLDLSITPKWRFLKRMSLKRSIEFWSKRS